MIERNPYELIKHRITNLQDKSAFKIELFPEIFNITETKITIQLLNADTVFQTYPNNFYEHIATYFSEQHLTITKDSSDKELIKAVKEIDQIEKFIHWLRVPLASSLDLTETFFTYFKFITVEDKHWAATDDRWNLIAEKLSPKVQAERTIALKDLAKSMEAFVHKEYKTLTNANVWSEF